jgi:hypothetical protein
MHLKYDKPMHTIVLVAALLLALLYVTFALMDANQYQLDVVFTNDALTPPWTHEQVPK